MENVIETYLHHINESDDIEFISENKIKDIISKIPVDKIKGLLPTLKSINKVEDLKKLDNKLKFLPKVSINTIEAMANKKIDDFKTNKEYALNKLNKIQKIPDK